MGWNSWNYFACDINATIIMDAADAMVATGLKDLGYEYINIDDCWAVHNRTDDGKLIPDPIKFPEGIKGVADYVHGLGLKLGIYSDAGTNTCQGQPGSLGHEKDDAESFAEWGVDYLKYDNCFNTGASALDRYPAMRDALNATARPIFYSICNWGDEKTPTWAPEVGNSWRTSADIKDFWLSMKHNFRVNAWYPDAAGPSGWNDPDMLEVGNGWMSDSEYLTHFNLWALIKAPLIIGCDMKAMSKSTFAILSNAEVIAVN
jgi:alpha-galactosidase